MSDDRERELLRQLGWRDFLLAAAVLVILVVAYVVISLASQSGTSLGNILCTFGLDIIANLIPVCLLFIVSYLLLRRVQALRSEQETQQLLSKLSSEVRKLLKEELATARQQGLAIHSADYGAGNTVEDVTQQVRELVSAGKLEMIADHNVLGIADPVKGVRKRLKVVYSHAVHNQTVIINEGDKLLLP